MVGHIDPLPPLPLLPLSHRLCCPPVLVLQTPPLAVQNHYRRRNRLQNPLPHGIPPLLQLPPPPPGSDSNSTGFRGICCNNPVRLAVGLAVSVGDSNVSASSFPTFRFSSSKSASSSVNSIRFTRDGESSLLSFGVCTRTAGDFKYVF